MAKAQKVEKPPKHLYDGAEWSFEKLDRVYDAIEEIANTELGLNVYPKPNRSYNV